MKKGVAFKVCFLLLFWRCSNEGIKEEERINELVSTETHPSNTHNECLDLLGLWIQSSTGCDREGKNGDLSKIDASWEFHNTEVEWNNFTLNYTVSGNDIFISGEPYKFKLLNKKTMLLKRALDKGYLKLEKKEELSE